MGLTSVAWGADADQILTLILGGVDGTVRVYRSAGGGWELASAYQVHSGWVRQIAVPRVPLGVYQKIGTVGDDDFAVVVKLTGAEVEIERVGPFDSQATSVGWALVDQVLVISHVNGDTSFWRETREGKWERTRD
jgi:hypothetical protein